LPQITLAKEERQFQIVLSVTLQSNAGTPGNYYTNRHTIYIVSISTNV